MAITHTFVSAVPDDGDPATVGSDEWNASHTIGAGTITDTHVAAANKDGVAGTASMRTLGTGAAQAAAGNHAHAGVYEPADATLTAIAALATDGLAEITGSGATAAVRAIGVGASTSIPTRADADTRYAAASHVHAAGDITSGTLSDARLSSSALYSPRTISSNLSVPTDYSLYVAGGRISIGAAITLELGTDAVAEIG